MPDNQQPQPDMMIPQLKAGAMVNVKMGGVFIDKIRKCFEHHMVGHEKELEVLKTKIPDQYATGLSPWEETAVMYSTLMQEVMRLAQEQGQIEEVSLKDTILRSSQAGGSDHS